MQTLAGITEHYSQTEEEFMKFVKLMGDKTDTDKTWRF